MTEEVDLIQGMMLSNRRPKTHLCNQTVGGEMGHVGKQLFWRRRLARSPNNMSTRRTYLFVLSAVAASA